MTFVKEIEKASGSGDVAEFSGIKTPDKGFDREFWGLVETVPFIQDPGGRPIEFDSSQVKGAKLNYHAPGPFSSPCHMRWPQQGVFVEGTMGVYSICKNNGTSVSKEE